MQGVRDGGGAGGEEAQRGEGLVGCGAEQEQEDCGGCEEGMHVFGV